MRYYIIYLTGILIWAILISLGYSYLVKAFLR
jgi:hypothetical protein